MASMADQVTNVMRQECHCDITSNDFNSSYSLIICSTEGRALTYRTIIDYSSESGNIVSSVLIQELQLFLYRSSDRDFNISRDVFITVVECPVAISNLSAMLCADPPPTCYIYNKPWVYALTLVVALLLGFALGAGTFCACRTCVHCSR